ncbi:hypothetical protein PsYK624_170560 [Phanerochaete sordida]|uniref:Uncharacterized protein n=1 Tax=Phanerochaete sordida TaxID=48140 RepID=A0A9P3GUH6_9APHY|nr:hypothetical protein PsYK624_170560 [Phanerochaete sordida]
MIVTPRTVNAYIATYDKPQGTLTAAPVTRHHLNEDIDIPDFFHIMPRAFAAVRVHSTDSEVINTFEYPYNDKFVLYWSEFPPGHPIRYTIPGHAPFFWNGEFAVFRRRTRGGAGQLVNFRSGDYVLARDLLLQPTGWRPPGAFIDAPRYHCLPSQYAVMLPPATTAPDIVQLLLAKPLMRQLELHGIHWALPASMPATLFSQSAPSPGLTHLTVRNIHVDANAMSSFMHFVVGLPCLHTLTVDFAPRDLSALPLPTDVVCLLDHGLAPEALPTVTRLTYVILSNFALRHTAAVHSLLAACASTISSLAIAGDEALHDDAARVWLSLPIKQLSTVSRLAVGFTFDVSNLHLVSDLVAWTAFSDNLPPHVYLLEIALLVRNTTRALTDDAVLQWLHLIPWAEICARLISAHVAHFRIRLHASAETSDWTPARQEIITFWTADLPLHVSFATGCRPCADP